MPRLLSLSLFCIACLVGGCSDDSSPQAELRNFVEEAADAAERRSADDLGDMIHDAYQDRRGYDKQKVTALLRAYFFQNRNIHLFTRIGEIELLGERQAQVSLHVAMAGSAIADLDALASLRARVFRFQLSLVKEDRWLLQQAGWEPASLLDME